MRTILGSILLATVLAAPATVGRSDWTGALKFSTVSGDIDVEFAGDLNADVELRTVSGDLDSDWPMTMNSAGRGQVRGRVRAGGRELSFSSVSGGVELRKAQ